MTPHLLEMAVIGRLLLLQVRWPFGGNVLVTEAAEMFQNYSRSLPGVLGGFDKVCPRQRLKPCSTPAERSLFLR
jgi:hypothetical protein